LEAELEEEEAELERRALTGGKARTLTSDASTLERLAASLASSELPWVEHLTLTSSAPLVASSTEDLEREVAIYSMTLDMAREGRRKLLAIGEPFRRPDDFFCEMLKSDTHMAKVKDELIFQQKKMDAFDQRKAKQHQLKFAKAVQAEKVKVRAAKRKADAKDVDDFRKTSQGKKRELLQGDKDDDGDGDRPAPAARKSKKRVASDKKWGFGGKKKDAKRNDPKSIDDMSSFDPQRGKANARNRKRPATASSSKKNGQQQQKRRRR